MVVYCTQFHKPKFGPKLVMIYYTVFPTATIIPLLSSTIDPYSPTNILQLGMVLIIRFTSLFRIFHLQLSKLTHLRLILTSCKLQPLLLLWSHHWGDLITSPQCQNAQHWQRTEQEDSERVREYTYHLCRRRSRIVFETSDARVTRVDETLYIYHMHKPYS